MPRYEQRDVSFDVPRHWDDKTLVAYAAPKRPGESSSASLVMTRDAMRNGETLKQYAERQLADLAQRMDAFELLGTETGTLGGLASVTLRFTAKAAAGPVEQRVVLVEGRRRSIYCFTATAPKAERDQLDPLFDRILSSVRFGDGEGETS